MRGTKRVLRAASIGGLCVFALLLACGGEDEQPCPSTPEPVCETSSQVLNFGYVLPTASADLGFTITNAGAGALTGTISEACDYFSLQSGAGEYSLTAGQGHAVTVRFTAPQVGGTYVCSVDCGNGCSQDVVCVATVPTGPVCSVEPTALDFGTRPPGQQAQQDFTIRNAGLGTLSGTVSENCDHYTILSGSGAYNLTSGQSRTVTVQFTAPATAGVHSCSVETGTNCAEDVSCTATVTTDPICHVSPTSLDFQSVSPGNTASRSFIIGNLGAGTLTGSVSENCDHYAIVQGGGAYSLTAGQNRTVTVQFTAPSAGGTYPCSVETGGVCASDVTCTATVPGAPICSVFPSTLYFLNVMPGTTVQDTFYVGNFGGGSLTGSVSESCGDFSLFSGGGAYSLGPFETVQVIVRFSAPMTPGSYTCTVETGTNCADDVNCQATVAGAPLCTVEPETLRFDTVQPGQTPQLTFTITNDGGGTLSGVVSESCGEYAITSGNGAYSLTSGESRTVNVEFTAPAQGGEYYCNVETGTNCSRDVLCEATVPSGPICLISVDSLDFGDTMPTQGVQRSFTITNVGTGALTGTVGETCDHYSLSVGGGSYSLTAGLSRTVTVSFYAPTSPGTYSCSVTTGASCAPVSCEATVLPVPYCSVSPDSLHFGTLSPSQFAQASFVITNAGGGTLSGTVSESCPNFALISGGDYDLGSSESDTIYVRFTAPAVAGWYSCTVETGTGCYVDVRCTAEVTSKR